MNYRIVKKGNLVALQYGVLVPETREDVQPGYKEEWITEMVLIDCADARKKLNDQLDNKMSDTQEIEILREDSV